MNFQILSVKILRKLKILLITLLFSYPRILKYKLLSNCKIVQGFAKYYQPTMLLGSGKIIFGKNVRIGVSQSPYFYNGYSYIDARRKSKIVFGDNIWINNSCSFISEGEGIEIGDNVLMGICCEIIDSDFHELDPQKRMGGIPKTAKVVVKNNVFLGSNVKIMKGVTIGENLVIANGAIVTKSIPPNVIAGGNPARVIRAL